MKRKRTREIRLVLSGAAALLTAGCDNSVRYVYRDWADCDREWKWESYQCEWSDGVFLGPPLASSVHDAPPAGSRAMGLRRSGLWGDADLSTKKKSSSTVKRGGFGSWLSKMGGSGG